MVRPDIDHYFLGMLGQVASRATCPRRAVGCIFVDQHNRILATGYNGVPRGQPHCTEQPCRGRHDLAGNTEMCLAVHAEQNAIMQCLNLDAVTTVYCTATPCYTCSKMLLNLRSLRRVVATELYPNPHALELWKPLERLELHESNRAVRYLDRKAAGLEWWSVETGPATRVEGHGGAGV